MSISYHTRPEAEDDGRRMIASGKGDQWSWATPTTTRDLALRDRARAANDLVKWREQDQAARTSVAHAVIGGMNMPVEVHAFHNDIAEVPVALVVRDHGSWWHSMLTIGVTGRG